MPDTDWLTEWKATEAAQNARLHTTWNAIVNSTSGAAIFPDGFAMTPVPLYAATPADLDRAEWHDGGRAFDAMLWIVEGDDIQTEVQIRNKKSGLWLGG